MGITEKTEKTVLAVATLVAILAIALTTGSQPIYFFWLLVPAAWIYLSKRPEELGVTAKNILNATLLGLSAGTGVGVVKYYLSAKIPWLTSGFLKYTAEYIPKVGILAYVIMIIAGDAIRELFYRGYLQTRFLKVLPPFLAIFLAAAMLGLTDRIEGAYSIIDATANGMISGYLFHRTKNLAASAAFMPTQFIIILALSQAGL